MKKAKVACYIDGFNLYHAIKSLPPPSQHLKWVDLWGLASAFIRHSLELLRIGMEKIGILSCSESAWKK